jgi:hypothetical protein
MSYLVESELDSGVVSKEIDKAAIKRTIVSFFLQSLDDVLKLFPV